MLLIPQQSLDYILGPGHRVDAGRGRCLIVVNKLGELAFMRIGKYGHLIDPGCGQGLLQPIEDRHITDGQHGFASYLGKWP
ncbi:hypothetical protein D3C80_1702760 [compost metagenome]